MRRLPGETVDSHYSLSFLIDAGVFTSAPDDAICYHLWVNRDRYYFQIPQALNTPPTEAVWGPEWGVMGMGRAQCHLLMEARFSMTPEYYSAIEHLRWTVDAYRHNPLFQGFDTMVREHLLGTAWAAHESYFFMISDTIACEDGQLERWSAWKELARYFHLAHRTGSGVLPTLSGIRRRLPRVGYEYDRHLNPIREYHSPTRPETSQAVVGLPDDGAPLNLPSIEVTPFENVVIVPHTMGDMAVGNPPVEVVVGVPVGTHAPPDATGDERIDLVLDVTRSRAEDGRSPSSARPSVHVLPAPISQGTD
jgi:hypothetical protein